MEQIDLEIFTIGGPIDKVYFDAMSEFQGGDSVLDAKRQSGNYRCGPRTHL